MAKRQRFLSPAAGALCRPWRYGEGYTSSTVKQSVPEGCRPDRKRTSQLVRRMPRDLEVISKKKDRLSQHRRATGDFLPIPTCQRHILVRPGRTSVLKPVVPAGHRLSERNPKSSLKYLGSGVQSRNICQALGRVRFTLDRCSRVELISRTVNMIGTTGLERKQILSFQQPALTLDKLLWKDSTACPGPRLTIFYH